MDGETDMARLLADMGKAVSDLVLAKSVAVGKTPRQTLLFDRSLYWPHIAFACCHHYETESTLHTNRFQSML